MDTVGLEVGANLKTHTMLNMQENSLKDITYLVCDGFFLFSFFFWEGETMAQVKRSTPDLTPAGYMSKCPWGKKNSPIHWCVCVGGFVRVHANGCMLTAEMFSLVCLSRKELKKKKVQTSFDERCLWTCLIFWC